eukprot:COSAG04_NODE_2534_length_3968_cov_2.070561_2_plen_385_part_00
MEERVFRTCFAVEASVPVHNALRRKSTSDPCCSVQAEKMSRGSLTTRVLQHMEDHDRPEGFTAGELSEATGMSTGQMSSLWKIYGDGASENMVRWKNGEEPPHHVPAAAKKRRQKEREEDPHSGIFYYRLTSAPARKAGAPKAAPKAAAADAEPPKKRHKKISIQAAIQSIACTACRRRDDEGSLVLCDGCDDAWHTFCMSPKRTEVPSGDWFCQHCLQAAQLRREGRTGGRRAKVPAPWNSAIVGHTVYGVLGPYKIERYAKLPQRSKTVTTGLGSIKTTWIRVYSASNRLLGLENGWPFRRFGGGAAPPPSPLLSWPPECPPRCAGWVGGRRGQGCSSAGGNLGSEAGAPPGFPSWRSELWVERAPMTPGRPLSTPAELGGR